MTKQETSILDGLKMLAPEAAAFLKSGLLIFNDHSIEVRSYLLAHIAREIEGGIRDILCSKDRHEICEKCGKSINNTNHQESILKSLGIDINTEFAEKWFKVAKEFNKSAHRHGMWKSPRDLHAFDNLWKEFLNILEVLVGNFYSITDRLDTIISNEVPSKEALLSLNNILSYEPSKTYFFLNLMQVGWLQPLYKANYFSGDNNPEPRIDIETGDSKYPIWIEMEYLKNIAWKMSQTPNGDFKILVKIIDDIFGYRKPNNLRIHNLNTDDSIMVLISCLPTELITKKHFDYLKQIIKSRYGALLDDRLESLFVERFINDLDKTNLLECLKIVFLYKNDIKSFDKYKSLFGTHFLYNLLKTHGNEIIKICGIEGLKIALQKLDRINDYIWYSVKAVEDHYQNGQDFDNYTHQLIVYIRESLLIEPFSIKLVSILRRLINKDSRIHSRIAYFIINRRYNELKRIFWKIDFNPLKNSHNDHELYELLKAHCLEFSNEQIEIILNWINELSDDWSFEGKKQPSQEKKMWLMSLLDTSNKKVKELYDHQCILYPFEIEHPGFGGWMSSYFGNASPLTIEEIEEMNLSEIISYFIKFEKQPKNHGISEPNIEGLCDLIKIDLTRDQTKYSSGISSIVTAPIKFQSTWALAIWRYCCDNKSTFTSIEVFSIIEKIMEGEDFWIQYNADNHWNNYEGFVNRVFSLMIEGLDSNKIMFEVESLITIKKIILIIFNYNKKCQEIDIEDLPNKYLNNTKGKFYEVLINYIVASSIKNNKSIDSRWDNDIKKIIESLLSKGNVDPLFYYALGKNFNSLYWIDANWVNNKISEIIPINSLDNWRGFIIGYHFYNGVTQIFETLNANGHYQKVFERRDAFDQNLIKSVINHICVAYHSDYIEFSIDSPLMLRLLNSEVIEDYKEIIHFYGRHIKHKELKGKVLNLWKTLFEINKNEKSDSSKYFLGECYVWLGYFDSIDNEIKQWLLLSAKNISQHSQTFFVSEIMKFLDSNPEGVGEVIYTMIISESQIGYIPDLEIIVEYLYKNGNIIMANKICEECAQRNNLRLRKIYKTYHQY